MRFACLAALLIAGCTKRSPESLELQRAAPHRLAPSDGRGCPWSTVETARAETDTLWVNETGWSVATDAAGEAFATLLTVCGEQDAVAPFLAWRQTERTVGFGQQDTPTQELGAGGRAASDVREEQRSSAAEAPEVLQARQTLIDALVD